MNNRDSGLGTRESDGGQPDEPEAISRRRALKVLGAVPLATALGVNTLDGQQQPVVPHTMPNPPAAATAQPAAGQAKRRFFTAREWKVAGVLADDIIPRDERSGSATEAGVLEYIDFHMSVPETTDDARVAMHGGLRWIDTESKRRFNVGYDKASQAQRHEMLDELSAPAAQVRPELRPGATFFSSFRNQVGAGFFSSAMGWKDLKYMGNTFNPVWDGCPKPALDKLGVSYDLMQTRVPVEK